MTARPDPWNWRVGWWRALRWRTRQRLRDGLIARVGPLTLALRLGPGVMPCQACQDRGWFYTKGSVDPLPPPPGYDGVSLCGCGGAVARLADSRRWRRQHDRRARHEPPF